MRTIIVNKSGELEIQNIMRPTPGPGEVLLKVHNCGICGTDLSLIKHHFLPAGVILGHEFSGEVAELGPGITDWEIGDRAACFPVKSCGECTFCREGLISSCSKAGLYGMHYPGGLSEYVCVKASDLLELPDHVSYAEAAFIEPLAVGLHAVNMASIKKGTGVIIMGAGTIGLCVLLWCMERKATIVVSNRSQERRDFISKLYNIATASPELLSQQSHSAQVIMECTGASSALQQAMGYAAPRGTIVCTGVFFEPITISPSANHSKELDIKFSSGFSMEEYKQARDAIADKRIDVKPLITETVGLDEFTEKFKELLDSNHSGKVQLEIN